LHEYAVLLTVQQLLYAEVLLKGSIGIVLLLTPLSALRALGLHRPDTGFWPRLLGAALLGLAIASFLQGYLPKGGGLGLAGSVAVNFTAAIVLLVHLILGVAAPSARGRWSLWAAFAILAGLALLEVAWVN
jgi:hypothetical protein